MQLRSAIRLKGFRQSPTIFFVSSDPKSTDKVHLRNQSTDNFWQKRKFQLIFFGCQKTTTKTLKLTRALSVKRPRYG